MKMQTPKNQQKKSPYTSPIGLLKNYNTVSASNNNNSYEQQFYRIKAHRLQAQVQQLKQENTILKAKLTDSTATNQILKQKIFVIENSFDRADRSFTQRTVPSFISDSGYPSKTTSGRQSPSRQSKYYSIGIPSQKTQRSVHNTEIQRLIKQNRILKNQHQVQMTQLKDQNKKLSRKILELENNLNVKINENINQTTQKQQRSKLEQKYSKLQQSKNELINQNQELKKQKVFIQQKLKSIEENNKSLRKQNQELKILNSSKNRSESVINDLKDQIVSRQQLHKKEIEQMTRQIEKLRKSKPVEVQETSGILVSRQVNKISEKAKPDAVPSSQNSKNDRQVELLKRKIALQQQSLIDKDQEIKNMLTKLKPLMQKQKGNSKVESEVVIGDPKRASLSILQVFLKKYKINSF